LVFESTEGKYTWAQANTACPLGWKLPSKADFEVLIAGNDSFKNTGNNGYWWTATENEADNSEAYRVRAANLGITTEIKESTYFVRCIKE